MSDIFDPNGRINSNRFIAREREALDAYAREAEALVESLNIRLRGSVKETLDEILQVQVREFHRILERTLRSALEDAFAQAAAATELGHAHAQRRSRGFAGTLQRGANFLQVLERAKRNL